MCGAHAAVRSILGEIVDAESRPTVVDIEAGLEHLSRGTARHVDALAIVVEPYFKSMETAARMGALGRELGVPRVFAVANKIRNDEDEAEIRRFLGERDLEVRAAVPMDELVQDAERRAVGPLDVASSSRAIDAIDELARQLS